MSETRGIFGLTEAVDQKLDNEWVPLNQVFHSNSRFSDGSAVQALHTSGYIWGGGPSSVRSSTDRISFATDTAARVPGNFNEPRDGSPVLTSSLTAGYTSGGGPGSLSNTEKITYSTEAYTLLPSSANLYTGRYELMAGGNSTQGYYVGGLTHGGSYPTHSSTDKITYSNETMNRLPSCNQPSSTFPSRKGQALSATTHGYFGGSGQPNNSSMDKMVYSVETLNLTPTAFLSTTSPSGRRIRAGSNTFGYFQYNSLIEKLTYSTDTLARIPSANLAQNRFNNAGTGGPSAGYFATGQAGPQLTSMEKVNYATDTPSAIPSNLPAARYATGAISAFDCGAENIVKPTSTPSPTLFQEGPNIGYIINGVDAPGDNRFSSTDKLNFTSDTTTRSPSANSTYKASQAASVHSSTAGYRAGGRVNSGSTSSRIEKLTFSSESFAVVPASGNLSLARYGFSGTSSPTAGYFGGGKSPAYSTMDKLTFSNDTIAYTPGANLTIGRDEPGATGNTTHGYFGGGNPGPRSTMDKLTYSNDTTAASPGAALSVPRYNLQAIGNNTHGYFGNGGPGPTGQVTDKLTYSNDTTAAAPSAMIPSGERSAYATTGNIASGYFCGGYYPTQSNVSKLVYSTDTTSLTPTAFLPEDKHSSVGTSSRMDGTGSSNIV